MGLLSAKDNLPLEGGPSFSVGHRIRRAIWSLIWFILAAWTPPPLHRWRAFILRAAGADVHPTARVHGSVKIWYPPNLRMKAHSCLGPGVKCYNMEMIEIGFQSVISQGVHLCGGTHDISDKNFQLQMRPIAIGDGVWVAADAFVGPGVSVGNFAVIGARAVIFKDIPQSTVYAGNPARFIKNRNFK